MASPCRSPSESPLPGRYELSHERSSEASQVFDILARSADRFGWRFEADGAWLVESIPCRTGTIHRVRTATGGDVAVKACVQHWSPDDARSAFEVLDTVDRLLHHDPGVSVPKPYGWDEQVPAICMSWADGVSLRSVLESGQHCLPDDRTLTTEAALGCGRAYGLLHAGTLESVTSRGSGRQHGSDGVTPGDGTSTGRSRHRRDKRQRIRVLRGPGSTPQNVLVSPDGHVTLVDSPRLRRLVSPHRALAKFLVHAFADLARSDASGDRMGPTFARFERAFLEGYAEAGPTVLHRRHDVRLLNLHRARVSADLAVPAFRTGRRAEALRLAVHAARLLVGSIRPSPLRTRASKG